MMKLTYRPAVEFPLPVLVELLNRGFAGYTVKIQFSVSSLLATIVRDSVNLEASKVVECDGTRVGIGLIAKRGWQARLAAMCIVTEFRGKRIGRSLLDHFFGELPKQGVRELGLEVIESNAMGVSLYQRTGFTTLRRLLSFDCKEPKFQAQIEDTLQSQIQLQPIDIADVASVLTHHPLPNLPWQLSGTSLMVAGPPHVAYQHDKASIILSDPSQQAIWIRSLVVEPTYRRQGQAGSLLATVMNEHPYKNWSVSAVCPEEIRSLFEKQGFQLGDISQLQMRKTLG
ncbi:MAG: GNAT family N-acetyltransferase [Chloroflexota bacterium]